MTVSNGIVVGDECFVVLMAAVSGEQGVDSMEYKA